MSGYLARKFIVVGSLSLAVAAFEVARGWHRGWLAVGFSAIIVAIGVAGLRAKP